VLVAVWYEGQDGAAQDQDGTSWSCSQAVGKPVWHIPLLCVQWKTPDDGQRNCPKYVEFHSNNKFEKLVHVVGFIVSNLTRGTVTRMSNHPTSLRLILILSFCGHIQLTGYFFKVLPFTIFSTFYTSTMHSTCLEN